VSPASFVLYIGHACWCVGGHPSINARALVLLLPYCPPFCSAGPWYVVLDGQASGANVQTVANTANAAWNPAAVTLYIERRSPTDTSNPFTVAAKLKGDATAWASVKARVVVSISQLDAFSTGALWFGVTGKAAFTPLPPGNSVAYRSAAGVRGNARFDNLFIAMTLPTSALKDMYGFTDTCLAPGVTIPCAVSVLTSGATNTSARVTGLSANFPYMVLVQAISAATGQLSAPAPPLDGTYFWARRMPPRQQKLALWLDAKWLPAGAVSTWSDASGNGHHMINTGAVAQKPVSVHANNGYGYDFINPGHVTFTRTSSQYLVGDADSIHFGVNKPMTVYWFAINRYSSTQVVMGRGAMATKLDTSSSGWVLGVSSTSFDTSTGFASMRVGAAAPTAGSSGAASAVAASQTRGWILNYGYQLMSPYIVGVSRVLLKNGSAVPSNADAVALAKAGLLPADYNATRYPVTGSGALLRTYACNSPACNTGTELPFFDERNPDFNNTYLSDPYQVTYVDTGAANGNLQAVPTVSSDLNFRIGGVPYSINTATAYGGDVFSVMVYNEDHDVATRSQVVQSTIVSIRRQQHRFACPAESRTTVRWIATARWLFWHSPPPGCNVCRTACVVAALSCRTGLRTTIAPSPSTPPALTLRMTPINAAPVPSGELHYHRLHVRACCNFSPERFDRVVRPIARHFLSMYRHSSL